MLVLRYKQPGAREFRVPFNVKIGTVEIPVGLALITVVLFALCVINLFTKQVATIAGVSFTLVFFAIFTISEKRPGSVPRLTPNWINSTWKRAKTSRPRRWAFGRATSW